MSVPPPTGMRCPACEDRPAECGFGGYVAARVAEGDAGVEEVEDQEEGADAAEGDADYDAGLGPAVVVVSRDGGGGLLLVLAPKGVEEGGDMDAGEGDGYDAGGG